ncbi:S8/S53 family peptidase [Ktedonobacter racemifer]|uniref:Peptidase S8 and S53 subtilisin kexin sedolisin n=1 Tax=Ktedonobacter racemifer DSM 44963 TaxID=485913 RepID=D6TKB2_KTERA|nr:S8/S53 family peptidase [Ktedonobacter racemifer]EFH86212.1 peptidase S8 and S53 subtilisin kexin sedolisin [Ktedonobacter racemifer DSM 44963]
MSRSYSEVMGAPNELYHWIPGELVVVVRLSRLPADEALESLLEQVRTRLNTFLSPYQLALEPYGTAGRWKGSPTMPPVRRRSFIFGLHRKQPLLAIFFHARHMDPGVADATPMVLSYLQARLDLLAQQGLQIVSAMPNWLVTAAPFFFSEGGPALPPRPAPQLEAPAPSNALIGWRMRLMEPDIPLDTRSAEDVLVAILDSAPHPDRIMSAATRPEFRRNWLLQKLASDLRNEDGAFSVEYDRYPLTNEVRTGRDYYNDARYYNMADHGLAVAGLIRDVAPRARIRLIRILNDFGGGDLYPLFAALCDLGREMVAGSIRRLVINLSLTIMPDVRRLPYVWLDQRQWPTTQLYGVTRLLEHVEAGLRLLFESLHAHGALIIAAAGNDSVASRQQNTAPRPPRAPARYDSVLSVSSVNSQGQASIFANAANVAPADTGVATFGGDGYGVADGNTFPDAVRGLYIASTFPNGDHNDIGWADWCGTSFSTAITSGLGAHLMAQGWSAANSMIRLSARGDGRGEPLFGAEPEIPSLLGNMIRVQQRFGL